MTISGIALVVKNLSLGRADLVKAAIRAGVCVNQRSCDEYATFFVVVHPSGTFYIPQSVRALDKLLSFLKKRGIDTTQLTTEFVALRCQTRSFLGLCTYSRVEWIHESEMEQRKADKYIHMRQWLAEEHMRPLAKPIDHGMLAGGRLIPTNRSGFQEIVKSDGKTARFILPLRYVPNFLVGWMVDYPL